ncbi:MAG: pepsin/retropepsin-like aspartic protease family protein [Candidatus Acidiferrales bacterium]
MRSGPNKQPGYAVLLIAAVLLAPSAGSASRQYNDPAAHRRPHARHRAHTADPLNLLSHNQYLKLEKALKTEPNIPSPERIFFAGVLANRKNQITQSIGLLKPLISNSAWNLTQEEQELGLRALADDYAKTFRYGDAADTLSTLLYRLGGSLDKSKRQDIEGDLRTYELLRHTPPETVSFSGPFDIASTRNKIGLVEIPVSVNGHAEPWALDTGANLSLLIRSRAEPLGLRLSPGTLSVEIFDGRTAPCPVSVIPRLTIGPATIRNVVVVVMDDKDYYVPQIHFQIEALLGYPVLSALGRITFYSDGRIRVDARSRPKASVGSPMFMEQLTPVVAADDGMTARLFTLDTGAANTFLTAKYLSAHHAEFAAAKKSTVQMAAHPHPLPAFYAEHVTLTIGGVVVHLKSIPVLAVPQGNGEDHFYGNLGQDVLKQFRSYTIDFRSMRFVADR